jgi:Rrf2 family protein
MKISQKLEYACRAMAQLAKHHDGRTLTQLEDLAQREEVSGNFLVQILNDLRRAGLVESRRGRAGGYLLAKSAEAITLRQVVEAVDPTLLQCSVMGGGESGAAVKQAWEKVSAEVTEALDGTTLESIVANPSGSMFYI